MRSHVDMIIKTKLQPPHLKPNTVQRDRLTELLKKNLDKKLILINAGAGYGKTTLLSQFITRINMHRVFYHLEATDSELTVFLTYVTNGLRQINPRFGSRTNTITKTVAYPNGFTDMILGTFINEFIDTISDETLIILDDYHNIDPSRQVDRALNYLFKHAPPNLHFIIATRQTPNFLLAQLRARRELFELSNEDMKFSRKEIKQLLQEIHGITLEADDVKQLEQHSEGWITSLQLILQSSDADIKERLKLHLPLPEMTNFREWWSEYFSYFAQEIYERESTIVKKFMVSCAILEWLNQDVCTAITGRRDSRRILKHLESNNVFVSHMPDGNYRFHNLYKEFLLSKWDSEQSKRKVVLKTAEYLRKKGHNALATPYYLQARHYKRAASIIRKVGYEMTNNGKSRTVSTYIEKLPPRIVKTDPELLRVYSYAQMFNGYPNDALKSIAKAIRLIEKQPKQKSKLARAYYDLGSIHFNLGNFKTARRWLTKALRTSLEKRNLASAAIQNSLGIILSKAGGKRLRDALDCFTKAANIVKRFPENQGLEASIINNWAMTERKAGNLQNAYKRSIAAVDLLKREEDFSPQFGSIFYNAVRLSLYLGKKEKALAILRLGLEHAEKYNDRCSLALIWRGYAIYNEQLGDLNMAKEYLTKAFTVFEEMQLKRMIILVNRDLCRIDTDLELLAEAEQNLTAAWDAKKTRDDADAVSILITEAKLRIAQGKSHHAERLLSYALKLTKKYGLEFDTFLILIEQAKVAHARAHHIVLESILRKITKLSRVKSYDFMLSKAMNSNRWMIDILMRSDRQYVLSVLKRWQVPYHLVEAYFFSTPHLIVDGRRIKAPAWKTSKALKLSCYLCYNHGKMISRDILINTLWKETSPRHGAKNLRKAVHHIRQAFGSVIPVHDNPVKYKSKKYQLSPDFSVWVDTEAFEELTQQAKKAKRRPDESKEFLLNAISLYQDGLAKGWYDDWIEDIRGYYAKKYEECLTMMVDILSQQKNYRDSISWCRRLVAHNNLDEQNHMKMWSVLAKLKKYSEIKKDFTDLKHVLRKELHTIPRPKTVEFYNKLVK